MNAAIAEFASAKIGIHCYKFFAEPIGVTMPVIMELRENDRVIYYGVTDPWTLGEFRALYTHNQIIREQHLHVIHAVANLSASQQLPRDILNAMHFSPDIRHPRAGYVYFVGPTPFVQ